MRISDWSSDVCSSDLSIIFASEDFGLHHLRFDKEAGAYTDQTGRVVAQWESKWDRPELWLLDFHHYLWAGDTGAIVTGWLALIGLCFVVTGSVLWCRSRRSFKLRPWPEIGRASCRERVCQYV